MSDIIDANRTAYCAWAKEKDDVSMSASGGIFYCLAKCILSEGGYVCGAVYSKDYKSVHHIISNDIEDIKRMRGSKYSQSNYGCIIDTIEEKCKSNIKVLFSGTPCQCFVVKERVKSKNLICIDLICNGVQDRRVLESEINGLESNNDAKISFYTMRFKKNNKQLPIYMRAEFENGSQCEELLYKTAFGKVYGARLALQKSCYHCRFKGVSRVGDITLGDYRGCRSLKKVDVNMYGSSTIIVNSNIGEDLFNKTKKDIVYYQAKSIKEVIWSNNRLVISGYKPSEKDINLFWEIFSHEGLERASDLSDKYLSRKGNITRRVVDRVLLIVFLICNRT